MNTHLHSPEDACASDLQERAEPLPPDAWEYALTSALYLHDCMQFVSNDYSVLLCRQKLGVPVSVNKATLRIQLTAFPGSTELIGSTRYPVWDRADDSVVLSDSAESWVHDHAPNVERLYYRVTW